MSDKLKKIVYEGESFGQDYQWESMLSAMDGMCIFEITKCGEGFRIFERCDRYYDAPLTKDQLLILGKEIIALAKS